MRSDEKQTTGCHTVRDGILLGVVLLTIAAAETNADERSDSKFAGANTNANAPPLRMPQLAPGILSRGTSFSDTLAVGVYSGGGTFAAPVDDAASPRFSATDFSPRKHTVLDAEPAAAAYSDTPMLHGTTVWQRMNDYRSHDRVRLLTLWQSSGSILSLQAG